MKPQEPRTYTHQIPLGELTVCLIVLTQDGELLFANTRDAKMDALLDYEGPFFAVWPGAVSSHLFHVNRREALKVLAAGGR